MSWWTIAAGWLFGGDRDKGIIEQTSDVVDKWAPSPVTKHKMRIEDAEANEIGATSARRMQFQSGYSAGKFESFITGLNSLMRPMFASWAFLLLLAATFGLTFGEGFSKLDPFTQGLVLTIVQFLFGVRVVSQDIPNAVTKIIREIRKTD
jgi:hypothetical protein